MWQSMEKGDLRPSPQVARTMRHVVWREERGRIKRVTGRKEGPPVKEIAPIMFSYSIELVFTNTDGSSSTIRNAAWPPMGDNAHISKMGTVMIPARRNVKIVDIVPATLILPFSCSMS